LLCLSDPLQPLPQEGNKFAWTIRGRRDAKLLDPLDDRRRHIFPSIRLQISLRDKHRINPIEIAQRRFLEVGDCRIENTDTQVRLQESQDAVPVSLRCSSEIASVWSAVSQSHGWPFAEQTPCPNCVTLKAVQLRSGIAAIRPHTTLVLPILRVCPPTTMIAISLRC
jgi:hypothetical protein